MRNFAARALVGCVLLMAAVVPVCAQVGNPAAEVKASDFAWFTGRWRGELSGGKFTAEQICSRPDKGEMLCLFRLQDGQKYIMYELYTLSDTPNGVELRSLHFATNLESKEVEKPLVMKLAKYSESEVVFEGAPGSEVKTSTLFRHGPKSMDGVILMVDQQQPHIEVKWTKIEY
jgi:hypothetical protein